MLLYTSCLVFVPPLVAKASPAGGSFAPSYRKGTPPQSSSMGGIFVMYTTNGRILLVNPKVPKLCLAYAVFEGPRTWKIRSTQCGHVAWKEVDQQYPAVLGYDRFRGHHSCVSPAGRSKSAKNLRMQNICPAMSPCYKVRGIAHRCLTAA
jgi:hypothetical protein